MGLIKFNDELSDGLLRGEYTMLPPALEALYALLTGKQPGADATREERILNQYTKNTIRTWEYTAIPLATGIALGSKFGNWMNLLSASAGIAAAEILAMVFVNRQIVLASQQAVPLDPSNPQEAHMLGIIKTTYERVQTNLSRYENGDPELLARLQERFGNSRKGRRRIRRVMENLQKMVSQFAKLKKLPDGFIARMTKDPNAFAFSPTDPAMAYTQGIEDQRFDPNIPEPAQMRDSHLLAVTGHEFTHLLEQDVLMLALVMLLNQAVSLLSDGVAKQVSTALEPLRAILSKVKWLKPIIDMVWDNLVGQLFYGFVGTLSRISANLVSCRREAIADLGAVLIIDKVEESGSFIQAEEAMAQGLERLMAYVVYRQENKKSGENDLYSEEFTELKAQYLQERLTKLGITSKPVSLVDKVKSFFADCSATSQARQETFLPRRNGMMQMVNPFVDFTDPGNLPLKPRVKDAEPQKTPTGPLAAIVEFLVWVYHVTKLDVAVDYVRSLVRLAQSAWIEFQRNHDVIPARVYMSREVIGKGAPDKVRFIGAVIVEKIWKGITGQSETQAQ